MNWPIRVSWMLLMTTGLTLAQAKFRQIIAVQEMRFATPEDEQIGAGCYLRIVEGTCDANSHLKTNIYVAKDILKQLCFMWICPKDLEKRYGMLIKECVATTKLGSSFAFIQDGCRVDGLLFGEAQTPEYSYSLTGARASMPIPTFADNNQALIHCTLSFCDICQCADHTVSTMLELGTKLCHFQPPRECSDYRKATYPPHRNYEIMSYSASDRLECQTTLAPMNNTLNMTSTAASPNVLMRKQHSAAWTMGTLIAFLVILLVSCRHN